MNLTKQELAELNQLLKNRNINLPDFRKEVGDSGSNYVWLQKNILKKNPDIDNRIKELLRI